MDSENKLTQEQHNSELKMRHDFCFVISNKFG